MHGKKFQMSLKIFFFFFKYQDILDIDHVRDITVT